MKKSFLLNLSMSVVALLGVSNAIAQPSSSKEILGARFIVDAPASIAGVKGFTYSSDPANTAPWGAAITTPVINAQVVKAVDSEACTAISSAVSGKWALIYRGNCEFGVKAKNAQNAGAAGVIIWNHTPVQLINMGAGAQGGSVTIPVVFISHEDGMAINNMLNASQTVTISIALWGMGKTHDLAIVPESPAFTHGGAVPVYQFDGNDVPAYRGYTGAKVANIGTSTESNIEVRSDVTFTPNGGSPAAFYKDTAKLTSITVNDSILDAFSTKDFKFNATGVGRYDFNYSLVYGNTDEYTFDNSAKFSFEVTPNVFSRGRFNVATQSPLVAGWSRVGGSSDWTWGPMFFNHTGGYDLSHLKFSLDDDDTSKHSLEGHDFIDTYIFKWNDGNSDGYMRGDELVLKGISIKQFTSADSARKLFDGSIGDAIDGKEATVVSEANSYYWVAVNLKSVLRLSVDNGLNYYSRLNAGKNFASNKHNDYFAPGVAATKENIASSDTIRLIAFGITNIPLESGNISQASYTQQGTTPAIALFTGVFPVSTREVKKSANQLTVFPNPATTQITAKIDFAKPAAKMYVKVIDAFGRTVYQEKYENVQQKEINITTSNLASGNYYVVVISNGDAISRPFSVLSK